MAMRAIAKPCASRANLFQRRRNCFHRRREHPQRTVSRRVLNRAYGPCRGFRGPFLSANFTSVRKSAAPISALAGSLALTVAATAFLFVNARMGDRVRFARAIGTAVDRIEARLHAYEGLLRGCAGLLAARPEVTADEFHAYADRVEIEQWYPGVQGVGFAQRVRPGQTTAVENGLRARGFAGLRLWPERTGDERTAIVLLEPLDRRNRAAIGYDMYTDPVGRDAMERARDGGSAAISGRVALVQEIDPRRQVGFLMYVPVYRGSDVPRPAIPVPLGSRCRSRSAHCARTGRGRCA